MKEATISYLSPVNSGGRTFAHQNKFLVVHGVVFVSIKSLRKAKQADQTSNSKNYHSFADI